MDDGVGHGVCPHFQLLVSYSRCSATTKTNDILHLLAILTISETQPLHTAASKLTESASAK
jgi:hypothetical protein